MLPRRRFGAFLLVVSFVVSPTLFEPAEAAPTDWVRRVNRWRAEYGASAVTADRELSRALRQHVRYMLAVEQATHEQSPAHPAYSPAGARAAQRSLLRLAWLAKPPARSHRLVDRWLAAPFHALAMLNPRLRSSGFAAGAKKGFVASGLDVRAGLTAEAAASQPVRVWPSARTTWLPQLRYHGTERPDPLSFCPAHFRQPEANGRPLVGLPLLVSLGAHSDPPTRVKATLASGGRRLDVCVISERSRQFDERGSSSLGRLARAVLAEQHSLIVVPRRPLKRGRTYAVSVQLPQRRSAWTFRTGSDRPPPAFWRLRRAQAAGRADLTVFLDDADLSRPPPLALESMRPGGDWRLLAVRRLSQRGQLTFRVSPRTTTRYRVRTVEPRPRRSRTLTVRR